MRDRLLDRRLVDEDRLEAPLEGGVLLDVLAVLVERRRADRVQLAAGEHRLEQVGGVHRALGRAGADDRVQLVDEQDDLALGVLDLLEDGLEPLLELAAELGAGDERAEVERDDALVLEALGHVAADDALGEALDDGRLADAGLADEDRVVLGPARQDLDDAADLLVAADDRIELARPRLGGQVAAVLLERRVGALRVLRGDALAAADALERLEDGLPAGAVALEQGLGLAADLGDAEQQVLGRDVLVAEPAGLGLGPLDDAPWRADRGSASRPGSGRAWRAIAASSPRNAGQVDAEPAERLGGDAVVGLDERGQEVLGVEDRALEALGGRLGGDDGLLGLLGEAVELHVGLSRAPVGIGQRGSGWSTRSRKVAAAAFGLVGQVGREDDPGLDVEVAVAVAAEARHALARRRNVRPGWVPAGIVSRTRPLSVRTGTSPPSSASSRVSGSSRSRSAPRRVNAGSGRTLDDDEQVAAAGRLAGQPDPGAGVGAARDRDLEALAVDLDQAGRAVVRLLEGDLGGGLGRRLGRGPGVDPASGRRRGAGRRRAPSRPIPAEDVLEASGRRSAGGPRPGRAVAGRRRRPRRRSIRKKSENSPASPLVRNS